MADLAATPGQTIGPFFHYALPYEHDRELVPVGRAGSVRLHGHVFDGDGQPVPDALIEIRQPDESGRVPTIEGSLRRDGDSFTGWGRSDTDASGYYWFNTIEPASARPDGPAFIAVVVFARGLLNRLFTRIYLPGMQTRDTDALLRTLDPASRDSLFADREADGSLRFDVHLQGERETVFLTYPGQGF